MTQMTPSSSELTAAIADAARNSFSSLFEEFPGKYYYCSLITTGEAHPPVISAWSKEALATAAAKEDCPEDARFFLKWSYADSPYCCFGEEFFKPVDCLFGERLQLTPDLTDEEWDSEFQCRLHSMEAAMAQLDGEGLFGTGRDRLGIVVLVEVMPPDYSNTERALRLNPPAALEEWLKDVSEES